MLRSLKTQAEPIMMYNPEEQSAHCAVYVVASMRERFMGLFQDLDFVEEYEDYKQDYIDTVKAYADDDPLDDTETTD
jgi:ribosomal protein S18 acetylase RimI-like enzyme